MTVSEIIILVIYVSILIEIVVFPVPSVASTYQLFFKNNSGTSGGLLQQVQQWPAVIKILLLLIPASFSVFIYCFPLAGIFINSVSEIFVRLPVTDSYLFILTAFLLMTGGRVLSFHAVLKIRHNNTQINNNFSLKTKGIFSHSRNPILLGMYITFIGILFIYPYRIMVLGLIIYIGNMHFRILLEEDFLKNKFGTDFKKYLKNTHRYL
ncbi:MAG: hypothetical protein GVY19_08935 [Bacteroidetes bacterium]|jgi:protein-S-isoprenylcysteine O-methyltransferase Ste14|nr:hypothetical protein [Bacteroidota bacterium]